LTYAGRKPDSDIRGIISQSPLVKLVKPPAKPLVWIVSILCKVLPNLQLYNPVLVTTHSHIIIDIIRANISLATPKSPNVTTKIPLSTAQELYYASTQC